MRSSGRRMGLDSQFHQPRRTCSTRRQVRCMETSIRCDTIGTFSIHTRFCRQCMAHCDHPFSRENCTRCCRAMRNRRTTPESNLNQNATPVSFDGIIYICICLDQSRWGDSISDGISPQLQWGIWQVNMHADSIIPSSVSKRPKYPLISLFSMHM